MVVRWVVRWKQMVCSTSSNFNAFRACVWLRASYAPPRRNLEISTFRGFLFLKYNEYNEDFDNVITMEEPRLVIKKYLRTIVLYNKQWIRSWKRTLIMGGFVAKGKNDAYEEIESCTVGSFSVDHYVWMQWNKNLITIRICGCTSCRWQADRVFWKNRKQRLEYH